MRSRPSSTNAQGAWWHSERIRALVLGIAVGIAPGCVEERPPQADDVAEPARPDPEPSRADPQDRPQDRPAPDGQGERGPPGPSSTPLGPVGPSVAAPVAPPSAGAALEDERNTVEVFRSVAPAAVFVTQSQLVRDRFTMRVGPIPAGTGTGFIWDTLGHVVTNFHVVDGGDSFSVTLWDDRTVAARLVGGDRKRDIAVLRLELDPGEAGLLTGVSLPPQGAPLVVGQKALAIGNPFGLDHTLTVGVISALEREVVGYGGVTIRDMIQTDASINPGNSGGPLLDSSGRLIGMNTMIFSKTGSSAGIGFAVPVQTVRRLVPQLIQYGRARRAGLGVELVADRIAARNDVRGVIIDGVLPGGPAALAGLRGLRRVGRDVRLGDTIVGIDDHGVGSYDELFNALDRYEPGDTVQVKVRRAGEIFAIPVTLGLVG